MKALIFSLMFCGLPTVIVAEDNAPANNDGFWECHLPRGSFVIRANDMVTVSLHEYRIDNTSRVYEATISSRSSVIARFYHMEPLENTGSVLAAGHVALERAQEIAREHRSTRRRAGDKTKADDAETEVVKQFPEPYAHTVDYRLARRTDVVKVFQSALSAWKSKDGGVLSLAEK